MTNEFLKRAKNSSSLISEQKILEHLSVLDKAVVITLDKLEHFQANYLNIKMEIERAAITDIHHFSVEARGIEIKEVIGERTLNDLEFHNLLDKKFKEYSGYCFVVNSGISYVMHNGELDSTLQSSLTKTQTMQEILNTKKNVSDLREVFENFFSACKYQKYFYEYCFNEEGMIKAEIQEQELRNLLMEYLNENVKGDVLPEFCTDYTNDEESVDIYLNDGIQRAIIEVKFAFKSTYYLGKTEYSFSTRVGAGIKQLDKYAQHLANGKRQVDCGFVYMFYRYDFSEAQAEKKIEDKLDELKDQLTGDFFSIYKGTITNDMKKWAILRQCG